MLSWRFGNKGYRGLGLWMEKVSLKKVKEQSILTRCRDRLGLVDFVRKESRFLGFID